MAKPTTPKKRIGRPTKPPKEGERIPIGLRVTPEMKRRLEAAASKRGRSLSQEVELRLERSLVSEKHLLLIKGSEWSPILFTTDELVIYISEEEVLTFPITHDQKRRLLARMQEDEEAEAAGDWYIQQQIDIKRGK